MLRRGNTLTRLTPDIQCSHIIRSAGICFQWWSCHCATDTLEGTPISSSILTVALQWYSWTDLYSVPFGVSRCLLVATYCVKNVPNHACLFFIFIFFYCALGRKLQCPSLLGKQNTSEATTPVLQWHFNYCI